MLEDELMLHRQPQPSFRPLRKPAHPHCPTQKRPPQELLEMLDMKEYKNAEAKLGTCIPAVDAKYLAQVACTVPLKISAGSSETQADFYRRSGKWVTQPSTSQDKLPFRDPKL